MGVGYQIQDRAIIDYKLWSLAGRNAELRGPRPQFVGRHFVVFTGAAQTFGRFVNDPFAAQIGRVLEAPAVNLGLSGAGPETFIQSAPFQRLLGEAQLHLCQVLSARSVSAGIFECGKNNGVLTFLQGKRAGETMLAADAYAALRSEYGDAAYFEQIVASQERWVELTRELLASTHTPTYLLWVSTKPIGEVGELVGQDSSVGEYPHFVTADMDSSVGEYPHFVTADMIDQVVHHCRGVVDCTFPAMRPQPLFSERSGELYDVWTREKFPKRGDSTRAFNTYYPTPAHHDLVTSRVIRRLAADNMLSVADQPTQHPEDDG